MENPLILIESYDLESRITELRPCRFRLVEGELYCSDQDAVQSGSGFPWIHHSLTGWADSIGAHWEFVRPDCAKLITSKG